MADTPQVVNTIANLIAFTPTATTQTVIVRGYFSDGDGGGGTFRWHAGSTDKPNGGTVVESTAASGVWRRLHDGVLSVRHFGAVGNGAINLWNAGVSSSRWSSFATMRTYYQTWCSDASGLGQLKGTVFEMMSHSWFTQGSATAQDWFTLDWVAINIAILTALKEGFKLTAPKGRYVVCHPIWMGYDEHGEEWLGGAGPRHPSSVNHAEKAGLVFEGESQIAVAEGISDISASITLVIPEAATKAFINRFTFRGVNPTGQTLANTDTFTVRPMWSGLPVTATSTQAVHSSANLQSNLNASVGTSTCTVTGPNTVADGDTWVIDVAKNDTRETKSWHGEFQVEAYSSGGGNWGQAAATDPSKIGFVRCYADCAIVSFRGTAQRFYRLANLTLTAFTWADFQTLATASPTQAPLTGYAASFGICFPHTAFTGFDIENLHIARTRVAIGILENNSANGENTYFKRVIVQQCLTFLYCNAGQAFGPVFIDCVGTLDGQGENGGTPENEDRYGIELSYGREPGFGLQFLNCGFTMRNNLASGHSAARNTFMRVEPRGSKTGTFVMTGNRCEHVDTVIEWNGVDSVGTMNFVFKGIDFGGMRGSSTRAFFKDTGPSSDHVSAYYMLVCEQCRFPAMTESGVSQILTIEGHPDSNSFMEFRDCRFEGWFGRSLKHQNCRFTKCLWSQSGSTVYREFSQGHTEFRAAGALSDLSRGVPSGPAMNRLKWSAHPANDDASKTVRSPWTLKNALGTTADFEGFQRNGRTNNDSLGLTAVSASSFAFKTDNTNRLAQTITKLTGAPDVVTYEAFVQVLAGSFTLSLADGPTESAKVYDAVLVRAGAWRHVTLTAQDSDFQTSPPTIRIRSEANNSIIQVAWQAAYHGVGPFSPIVTEGTESPTDGVIPSAADDLSDVVPASSAPDQFWSHVLPDLRVPDRFVLPNKRSEFGYLASSAQLPGLISGEVYLDGTNGALMMYRGGDWFVVGDIARWQDVTSNLTWDVTLVSQNRRFLVVPSGTSALTVDLKTESVPNGMRVTLFNKSASSITLNTKTGSTSTLLTTVTAGKTVTVVYRKSGGGADGWYLESQF